MIDISSGWVPGLGLRDWGRVDKKGLFLSYIFSYKYHLYHQKTSFANFFLKSGTRNILHCLASRKAKDSKSGTCGVSLLNQG